MRNYDINWEDMQDGLSIFNLSFESYLEVIFPDLST